MLSILNLIVYTVQYYELYSDSKEGLPMTQRGDRLGRLGIATWMDSLPSPQAVAAIA